MGSRHTFSVSTLAVLCFVLHATARAPTRLIYQHHEVGSWYENVAVRRDGSLLLTSLNKPGGLSSLNPFDGSAAALLTNDFDDLNSTLGIVETVLDTFWIIASNFSVDPATLGTQAGSNTIFKAVFSEECNGGSPAVTVSCFAKLPSAKFLNGLTKFNDTLLLAADSGLGAIWGINIESGSVKIVAKDPLMQPVPVNGFGEGINGLHFDRGTLYFSNSQKRVLGKVDLDDQGRQNGPAVAIASPKIEKNVNPSIDDFAIDGTGNHAYVATLMGNSIQRIDLRNGDVDVFAGCLNSTAIAQPVAAKFGRTSRDKNVLYVITAGGLGYPVYTPDGVKQIGAQVVAVETGKD